MVQVSFPESACGTNTKGLLVQPTYGGYCTCPPSTVPRSVNLSKKKLGLIDASS